MGNFSSGKLVGNAEKLALASSESGIILETLDGAVELEELVPGRVHRLATLRESNDDLEFPCGEGDKMT